MSHVWNGKPNQPHHTRKAGKNGRRRMVLPNNAPKKLSYLTRFVDEGDPIPPVEKVAKGIVVRTVVFPILGDEYGLDINA